LVFLKGTGIFFRSFFYVKIPDQFYFIILYINTRNIQENLPE